MSRAHLILARFFSNAGVSLAWMHAALWLGAMIALGDAFQAESAPSGPRFNSALAFISRIDLFVSASAKELATDTAIRVQAWFSLNLTRMEVILFGGFVLFLGTFQWLLLGRGLAWLAGKFGDLCASLVGACIGFWVALAVVVWIRY